MMHWAALGMFFKATSWSVAFVLLGSWLDTKFSQNYIFTLATGVLGIGIGLYNLIRTVTYLEKRNKIKNEKK